MTEQMNKIRKWIVNDYFTPNIKAEVILDTLLTPYVTEILKDQTAFKGELHFITKEMSVLESKESEQGSGYGNRGTKIDYVLGDEEAIYLVELKTTGSSINLEQADRYLRNCCSKNGQPKTFGQVFGNKLLSVMKGAFGDTYEKSFPQHLKFDKWGNSVWDGDKALWKAFLLVFRTRHLGKKYDIDEPSEKYAEAARELIRRAGWTQKDGARSRKYLYTAGQLLDYLHDHPKCMLWDKPLKLIYLTPAGECPSEEFKKEVYRDFYIGSLSLLRASEYLKKKQEDELALLLSGIIEDIYER